MGAEREAAEAAAAKEALARQIAVDILLQLRVGDRVRAIKALAYDGNGEVPIGSEGKVEELANVSQGDAPGTIFVKWDCKTDFSIMTIADSTEIEPVRCL